MTKHTKGPWELDSEVPNESDAITDNYTEIRLYDLDFFI